MKYSHEEENFEQIKKDSALSNLTDEPEPIYVMTVELEEGKSQAIKIYADSTPNELAFEFCKQNNLDISSMNYLSEQIRVLLEELHENLNAVEENKIISEDENECIQEVDEEEDGTDTRKTNKSLKSFQTPNSQHQNLQNMKNPQTQNYINNSNNIYSHNYQEENDSYVSPQNSNFYKNYKNVNPQNVKNESYNTSNFNNNSMPEMRDEHLSHLSNFEYASMSGKNKNQNSNIAQEISLIDKSGMMGYANQNYENDNIIRNKEIKEIEKEKDSNSLNNLNKNSIEQSEYPQESLSKSKSRFTQDMMINQSQEEPKQKLFSYQVFYDNFKKKEAEKLERLEKSENSQMRKENKGGIMKEKDKETIFEKLFRNAESKRYGMMMRVRHDNYSYNKNNDPNSNTIKTVSSSFQVKNPLLNSSATPSNTSKNLKFKNGEVINYGERLYQKGLKLKEETNKKLESIKQDRDSRDATVYTYHPRINEVSPELMRKRSEGNLNYNKEDYVSRYNVYLEEKLDRLRSKHEKKESFNFSPSINRRSEKMANDKLQAKALARVSNSLSPDMHKLRIEDLYELAKVKQFRIQELSKQIYSTFNYKPQINSEYNNSKLSENALLNLTFEQRLDAFRKKSVEKKKVIEENLYSNVDSKTGQNFFIPKLMSKSRERINNFADRKDLNNSKLSKTQHTSMLFQNLYSYAKKFSKNKEERKQEFDSTIKKFSGSIHTTNDSEIIFSKKKEEIFKKIFRLLDSDQDNQISTMSIYLKKIPQNILQILQPIISELKEENECLNENEFVRACEHLYEMLNYNEKRALLEFDNKKQDDKKNQNNFTFKPTIDRNSKRIAESKQFTYSYIKTIPITTENKLHSLQTSSIVDDYTLLNKKSGKSLVN